MSDKWDEQIENDIKAGKLDKLSNQALADYEAGNTRVTNDEPVFLELIESPVVKIKSVVVNADCPHCKNKYDYTINHDGVTVGKSGYSGSVLRYFSGSVMCMLCKKVFTIRLC